MHVLGSSVTELLTTTTTITATRVRNGCLTSLRFSFRLSNNQKQQSSAYFLVCIFLLWLFCFDINLIKKHKRGCVLAPSCWFCTFYTKHHTDDLMKYEQAAEKLHPHFIFFFLIFSNFPSCLLKKNPRTGMRTFLQFPIKSYRAIKTRKKRVSGQSASLYFYPAEMDHPPPLTRLCTHTGLCMLDRVAWSAYNNGTIVDYYVHNKRRSSSSFI